MLDYYFNNGEQHEQGPIFYCLNEYFTEKKHTVFIPITSKIVQVLNQLTY